MKKTIATLAVVSTLIGAATYAHASEDKYRVNAPRDQWMSVEQISAKFTADGYKVRQVKEEDGLYEIYALDAKGARVEVYVHPVTGEILKSDMDD